MGGWVGEDARYYGSFSPLVPRFAQAEVERKTTFELCSYRLILCDYLVLWLTVDTAL